MLSDRQKLSLQHLREKGITDPLQIIEWAEAKAKMPQRRSKRIKGGRKHSIEYYQQIALYVGRDRAADSKPQPMA